MSLQRSSGSATSITSARRAYRIDLTDFMNFVGIAKADEFRIVTRSHIIAWRKSFEGRELSGSTVRRKLSALSSLFEYLCECNAVTHNPVKGVKRPRAESGEGKTPALGDAQARRLLNAPKGTSLKGKRDRAILSVLLYHGLRRGELCLLRMKDITERRGVKHLRIRGKGGKTRYVLLHPGSAELIASYFQSLAQERKPSSPLFQPVKDNTGREKDAPMTTDGVYKMVWRYAEAVGLNPQDGFGAHSLRATAATNALEHEADIAKVQQWLGHASIATTRLYDKRRSQSED